MALWNWQSLNSSRICLHCDRFHLSNWYFLIVWREQTVWCQVNLFTIHFDLYFDIFEIHQAENISGFSDLLKINVINLLTALPVYFNNIKKSAKLQETLRQTVLMLAIDSRWLKLFPNPLFHVNDSWAIGFTLSIFNESWSCELELKVRVRGFHS